MKWSESRSAVSDSFRPHGLYSPWNSPSQNTGVGSHSLLQGTFPSQGCNPGLPRCRRILYQLDHQGSPEAITRRRACPARGAGRVVAAETQEVRRGESDHRWPEPLPSQCRGRPTAQARSSRGAARRFGGVEEVGGDSRLGPAAPRRPGSGSVRHCGP